jgi:hypothetical protein
MQWSLFFRPGTPVTALPRWEAASLYIDNRAAARRWRSAGFFPGWTVAGRSRRLLMKVKAALLPPPPRTAGGMRWELGDFLAGVIDDVAAVSVMTDSRNPSGKSVARLFHRRGGIAGYVKFGTGEAIRGRLRNEFRILSSLPAGVGPAPLKFGEMAGGVALCLGAVNGKSLPLSPRPGAEARSFLARLPSSPQAYPLDAHPWIRDLRSRAGAQLEPWLETLCDRRWPATLQHGDFAPWNLVRTSGGALVALDWEYACAEGFPLLDLAYYLLQMAVLVRRRGPARALRESVDGLGGLGETAGLGEEALRSLVALAAFEQYTKSMEDGGGEGSRAQQCRLSIWRDRS